MPPRQPHSPETLLKIGAANAGKKRSEETRLRMRLAKLGKPVLPSQLAGLAKGTEARKMKVSIEGAVYESIARAAEAHGVSHEVMRRRVHSDRERWAYWRFVE